MNWKTFLQSEDGMKWKTFLQIVLLMIVAAVIFYVVYPKYYWKTTLVRGNKITGRVECFVDGKWRSSNWKKPIKKRGEKKDEEVAPLALWLLTPGGQEIRTSTCQLSKVFLAHDPKYKKLPMELLSREIQIENIFQGVLINKTPFDLSSEEGKNELVRELVNRVNEILREGQIETIYMEMIVQ
ncbi:flagellar basal body-associated FliL family protein [bacterium]|nr:flagellar basal body-associated FliL family protein [bacterium]